ncbi:hypothetical protein [Streptomyces sp. WG7]
MSAGVLTESRGPRQDPVEEALGPKPRGLPYDDPPWIEAVLAHLT